MKSLKIYNVRIQLHIGGRFTISVHMSKHCISLTLMIGTWVPTGSPPDAKYCSRNFNERNTLVVIESIKTTKSNDVIRKLEPTFYFPIEYGLWSIYQTWLISFLMPSLHFLNAVSLTHPGGRELMLNSGCTMICKHVKGNVSSRYLEAVNRIYKHNIIFKCQDRF